MSRAIRRQFGQNRQESRFRLAFGFGGQVSHATAGNLYNESGASMTGRSSAFRHRPIRSLPHEPRRRTMSAATSFALLVSLLSCAVDDAGANIDEWIARLGSNRYSQREAAAKQLEELGRGALPALRKAAAESPDPEIQVRAAVLQDRIEEALTIQPSMVRLNFGGVPLRDAIEAFGKQAEVKFSLSNANDPRWSKPVVFAESDPLPFWSALDRLCELGEMRLNLLGSPSLNRQATVMTLTKANGPPPKGIVGAVSRQGPFSAVLTNLNYTRNVTLANGNEPIVRPSAYTQFTASMQVYAEPRLMISSGGPPIIKEAIDDLGNALTLPVDDSRGTPRHFVSSMPSIYNRTLAASFSLIHPEQAGETIRRIAGTLPLTVAAFRSPALTAPLANAASKTFSNEIGSITVNGIDAPNAGNPAMTIELTIRPSESETASTPPSDLYGAGAALIQTQLEILDAKDNELRWHVRNINGPKANGEISVSVYISTGMNINPFQLGPDGNPIPLGPPDKIRYRALRQTAAELVFEFRDVPMP